MTYSIHQSPLTFVMMKPLEELSQLDQIDQLSASTPVLLFKHSTRCSISQTALTRFLRVLDTKGAGPLQIFLLDLLNHRDISNEIARRYDVVHESPQTLLLRNAKCVQHASHLEIDLNEILQLAMAEGAAQ